MGSHGAAKNVDPMNGVLYRWRLWSRRLAPAERHIACSKTTAARLSLNIHRKVIFALSFDREAACRGC
jgi:hypothetical protein